MTIVIRDALDSDLPSIETIYNHYVATSTCTYQLEPLPLAERTAWFARHGAGHPVIVATDGEEVVGWGSLSGFRDREGYRFTVENTVYVDHRHHRRGIGRLILADLIRRARAIGHQTIIAGISAEQAASIALHASLGFTLGGRLARVGYKFDTWLDVVFMQLML